MIVYACYNGAKNETKLYTTDSYILFSEQADT